MPVPVEGALHDLRGLLRAEHDPVVLRQRRDERVAQGGVDDDVLLRAADQAVVKGLAQHDRGRRLRDVGVRGNPRRRVARTDTDRRLATRIGGLDHPRPPRRKDQRDIRMAHELRRAPPTRPTLHPLHQHRGRTMTRQRRRDDLPRRTRDTLGHAMTAEDDRVARLQRDQRLVGDRRHRIGDRHQREDHPHRTGDLGDLQHLISPQDPASLPALQGLPHPHRPKRDLRFLVIDITDRRLSDRLLSKLPRTIIDRRRDVLQQRINTILRPTRKLPLRDDRRRDHLLNHAIRGIISKRLSDTIRRRTQPRRRVATHRPQHRDTIPRALLIQTLQRRLTDTHRLHIRVSDRTGPTIRTAQQRLLPKKIPRHRILQHRIGIDVLRTDLDPHLTTVDDEKIITRRPLLKDPLARHEAHLLTDLVDRPQQLHPEGIKNGRLRGIRRHAVSGAWDLQGTEDSSRVSARRRAPGRPRAPPVPRRAPPPASRRSAPSP